MNHEVEYKLTATKKAITLTLTVPNDVEGGRWLHDLVAIKIAQSGRFIADVYNVVPGRASKRSSTFTPRFRTFEDYQNAARREVT